MNARMSVLITMAASLPLLFIHNGSGFAQEKDVSRHVAQAQVAEHKVTIVLQIEYLDGDVSEEVITDTSKSMLEIQEKYKQWELISSKDQTLVFRCKVDDISPLLKANGYFGITEEGTLTIFNGKPKHSKVIHSFFQIDVGKLESRKRQQLLKGIPIRSKDRYQEVLETFKPYSKYE